MENDKIKIMSIMAHQDDFEFSAGGTFAQLKQRYGNNLQIKLVNTSKGASGHHIKELDETFGIRMKEFRQSASLLGAECECLTQLDGNHVPAQVFIDRNFLGGLWNTIRAFEPDYIFTHPITHNPLNGIHVDHFNTATGVRMVAYQLCVPHAYPTLRGPVKQKIKMPLIINLEDFSYSGAVFYHIVNDITSVFDLKMRMAFCHRSQVMEWLPFSRGEKSPTEDEFRRDFIAKHKNINLACGKNPDRFMEYFAFTSWGRKPVKEDIEKIFMQPEKDENYRKFVATLQK